MLGNCKDCKWWGAPAAVWLSLPGFRTCDRASKPGFGLIDDCLDYEGTYSEPTFGCVHFEPKPTENTDT